MAEDEVELSAPWEMLEDAVRVGEGVGATDGPVEGKKVGLLTGDVVGRDEMWAGLPVLGLLVLGVLVFGFADLSMEGDSVGGTVSIASSTE